MTFPRHFLCVFGGTIGVSAAPGVEDWQVTLRLAKTSTDYTSDPDPATVMVQEQKAAIETWMTTPGGGWSNQVRLEYLKCNEIDASGRYKDQTGSNRYDYPASGYVYGVNGPASFDPAAALVITWGTAFKRGHAHQGRMFLPCPAFNPTQALRVSPASATSIAAAAGKFIQDMTVGGLQTNQWGPCVVSGLGSGAANEIQSVRVGDVMDHQLRRRDRMVESYTVHTI